MHLDHFELRNIVFITDYFKKKRSFLLASSINISCWVRYMRNEFSKNYYLLSITGRRGFLKITYERSLQKIDCIIFKKNRDASCWSQADLCTNSSRLTTEFGFKNLEPRRRKWPKFMQAGLPHAHSLTILKDLGPTSPVFQDESGSARWTPSFDFLVDPILYAVQSTVGSKSSRRHLQNIPSVIWRLN